MDFTKIFGWVLLIVGVVIIVGTLYSSFNIFTGKGGLPEIFKIEKKETPPPNTGKTPTTPEELQKEMERVMSEQLRAMIPVDTLPKLLNLAVWAMLAFILIQGGAQLSNLGIKLLKKW